MAVTNYYSVGGEIIGERMAGGSRTDYLTDALGNVTATLNQSAQVVNTYRYKPYGGLLAKTGMGTDPAFGWNGTHGYRPTARKFSDFYIRARHYDSLDGRWTTHDLIKGANSLYCYAQDAPCFLVDASGMYVSFGPMGNGCDQNTTNGVTACCQRYNAWNTNPGLPKVLADCVAKRTRNALPDTSAVIDQALKFISDICDAQRQKPQVCLWCCPPAVGANPPPCPGTCSNSCGGNSGGYTIINAGIVVPIPLPDNGLTTVPLFPISTPKLGNCVNRLQRTQGGCQDSVGSETSQTPGGTPVVKRCDVSTVLCKPTNPGAASSTCPDFLHEMLHGGGLTNIVDHDLKRDFIYALSCCMCTAIFRTSGGICLSNCEGFRGTF